MPDGDINRMAQNVLAEKEAQEEMAKYHAAIQAEFTETLPSAEDTPEEIAKKTRQLFINMLPKVAAKIEHVIDRPDNQNILLKACDFAYKAAIAGNTVGTADAFSEMLRKLTPDKAEATGVKAFKERK